MDVKELYLELEKESQSRSAKGEKAEKIRGFIRTVAKEVQKPQLSLAALYKLTKRQFPEDKIDRSYFVSIVQKTWETSKDDNGNVLVEIGHEKIRKE